MKRSSLLNQQRAALQRQIWQIASDVRGSVNGSDFNILVLSKHKTKTQFIETSSVFKKETNHNVLLDEMDAIVAGIEGGRHERCYSLHDR